MDHDCNSQRPSEYSFTRYLRAKKSVDDRALNQRVWQALVEHISVLQSCQPVQVVEIGAGIGTMIERALDWGLVTDARYTALDNQHESISSASQWLPEWAIKKGYSAQSTAENSWEIWHPSGKLEVEFITEDVFAYVETITQKWDLLIAHAVLDLMDIPNALPALFRMLNPGGYFYFSLNFDGATIFEPVIDAQLDAAIEMLYHHTMDERMTDGKRSGDSRSGRHLFRQLAKAGAKIIEAGASDWIVYPRGHTYPLDEAYFLHHILRFIETSLSTQPGLHPGQLSSWIEQRHAQVERGELVYIAHQVDFLGKWEHPPETNG